MALASELISGVDEVLNYGEKIRIKYYNQSFGAGSYYDDDTSLTQSGVDFWTSGIACPIDNKQGSYEALLLQQGKLLIDDKKIYIRGNSNIWFSTNQSRNGW